MVSFPSPPLHTHTFLLLNIFFKWYLYHFLWKKNKIFYLKIILSPFKNSSKVQPFLVFILLKLKLVPRVSSTMCGYLIGGISQCQACVYFLPSPDLHCRWSSTGSKEDLRCWWRSSGSFPEWLCGPCPTVNPIPNPPPLPCCVGREWARKWSQSPSLFSTQKMCCKCVMRKEDYVISRSSLLKVFLCLLCLCLLCYV